jgi:hypothetical protein
MKSVEDLTGIPQGPTGLEAWPDVIGWHILLPAFTVGCESFIAELEALKLATGRDLIIEVSNG